MQEVNKIKVKLFTGGQNRITLSNRCVEVFELQNIKCKQVTFVPVEPWLPVSNHDFKQLCRRNNMKLNDVALIKMPSKIIRSFKKLVLEKCITAKDIEFIQSSNDFFMVKQEILSFLLPINDSNVKIESHNIFFGKPNLKQTTYNSIENVYIGMHLDSWEGEMLEKRHLSRNRICINIGLDSRYLLFYNIDIQEMAKSIGFQGNADKYEVNSIYPEFAKKFPNTPIYRLEIKPFEAYIAPTEFLIHDGSSWNSSFFDINVVFRGKFIVGNQNIFSKIIKFLIK